MFPSFSGEKLVRLVAIIDPEDDEPAQLVTIVVFDLCVVTPGGRPRAIPSAWWGSPGGAAAFASFPSAEVRLSSAPGHRHRDGLPLAPAEEDVPVARATLLMGNALSPCVVAGYSQSLTGSIQCPLGVRSHW